MRNWVDLYAPSPKEVETTRRTIRRVTVLAVAALMLTALAVPAQGAGGGGGKNKCRVKNMRTGEASGDLQAQIDAAANRDTLKIKGVCVGNFTIPDWVSLTLLGVEKAGVQATLDGNGSGTVLKIGESEPILLIDLAITGGLAENGGGIYTQSHLRLSGSSRVTGNTALQYGGGIYSEGCPLELFDSALVGGNNAGGSGGGIYNDQGMVVLDNFAQVFANTATYHGGGIYMYGGPGLYMFGSSQVSGNTAGWHGGGIYLDAGALLSTYDSTQVSLNTAREYGGGILNYYGYLDLSGQVSENRAWAYGGGIFQFCCRARVTDENFTATGNIADANNDGSGEGGGIYGCVEGAVDGGNVDDNYQRTDASQVEDNIANGCP